LKRSFLITDLLRKVVCLSNSHLSWDLFNQIINGGIIRVSEENLKAVCIYARNQKGVLKDISGTFADHNANIVMIHLESIQGRAEDVFDELYVEYEGDVDQNQLMSALHELSGVKEVIQHISFGDIYGKRVIIIGGGAQVAQVAMGAVNEADRHNIRGERISVDTIPLVGEKTLSQAIDAVTRLPRVEILVLAGSIMGGSVSDAVERVKVSGIPVIALNMAGSVVKHADLVVTDPIQAGVFAVMHVSTIAVFDVYRVRGRKF
jgi:energy-converting hydrogenase B subunit Q